jgi:hypothetical protein
VAETNELAAMASIMCVVIAAILNCQTAWEVVCLPAVGSRTEKFCQAHQQLLYTRSSGSRSSCSGKGAAWTTSGRILWPEPPQENMLQQRQHLNEGNVQQWQLSHYCMWTMTIQHLLRQHLHHIRIINWQCQMP